MEAVGACPKIFMGLALVHFQKYWLLNAYSLLWSSVPHCEVYRIAKYMYRIWNDHAIKGFWKKKPILALFWCWLCFTWPGLKTAMFVVATSCVIKYAIKVQKNSLALDLYNMRLNPFLKSHLNFEKLCELLITFNEFIG